MFSLLAFIRLQQVSWRDILRFLHFPLAFAIMGLLSIVLVLDDDASQSILLISRWIPLSITSESLKMGEIVLWRVLNALLTLCLFKFTTSISEKYILAEKLYIPKSLLEIILLSYRYIYVLNDKMKKMIVAQRLRLGYTSYGKSFKSLSLLLSTVFLYSISVFRANYQALTTRGYNGTLYYTTHINTDKGRWWVIGLVIIILAFIIICYQNFT